MMSPITLRRLQHFRANRRGYWSLWIFLGLFFLSLFAEVVANDKPLLVIFEEHLIFPIFETIPETEVKTVIKASSKKTVSKKTTTKKAAPNKTTKKATTKKAAAKKKAE